MTVSADAPLSKKAQIANALRGEIDAGQPAVGQKLASLRELADRFEVTTVTVGSALQILVDEGRIFSVPNRGYFVSPTGDESTHAEESQQLAPQQSAEFSAITRHLAALESTVQGLAERIAQLEELTKAQH